MVKRGKKYAGQERWENDVRDIQRITTAPRVGKIDGSERSITIGGKPVKFDQALLLDLLRRRQSGVENDGLKGVSYDGGGASGTSESTPTERAALAGLPEKPYDREGYPARDDWSKHVKRDPVAIQLEEAFSQLDIAARALRAFERKVEIILNADSRAKEVQGRESQCEACGEKVSGVGEDRRKSGYGPCCYWRYREWMAQRDDDGLDPSHVTFQMERRVELNAAKALAVESA